MEFLTGLLASIIRPIIQGEILELKKFIVDQNRTSKRWEAYDKDAEEMIKQMADSNLAEERWAILARIKASRPKLND